MLQKLSLITLESEFLQLGVIPSFGCHWAFLKFKFNNSWIDILDPLPSPDTLLNEPLRYGSFIMAPWTNRIPNGNFTWNNKNFSLKKNFSDGSSIHGDVYSRQWHVINQSKNSFEAIFDSSLVNDFNFPFPLKATLKMKLEENDVDIQLSITNIGIHTAPISFGFHPFFKRGLILGEAGILKMSAEKVFPSKTALPTGPAVNVLGRTDFREGKDLKTHFLDDGFTDFTEPELSLFYPASKIQLSMSLGKKFNHVFIYSPEFHGASKADFVCIEPMTAMNNAFQFQETYFETGLKKLAPNESFSGELKIKISSPS